MHRLFLGLSRLMAITGGLVLSGLIVLTCLSVVGRSLNGILHNPPFEGTGLAAALLGLGVGPINGDYEIIEAGIAFAIFAFLPLCQITGSHAVVDVFTDALPPRALRVLQAAIEVLFAVVLVVIAVQLASGTASKFRSGQTTFLIEFPVWWAYAPSLAAAVVAATVGAYMAAIRVAEAVTGRALLPVEGAATGAQA